MGDRMDGRRLYATTVGVLVVGALLWPVSGRQKRDSFPLSSYPMFTTPRKQVAIYAVVGMRQAPADLDGAQAIPLRFMVHNDVMQASVTVRRAARQGKVAQQHLCRQAAEAVARDRAFSHITTLSIVRDVYEPLAYFTDGRRLGRRSLYQCPVVR